MSGKSLWKSNVANRMPEGARVDCLKHTPGEQNAELREIGKLLKIEGLV